MEDDYGPPKKRIKQSNCVICDRPLSDKPATKNPTEHGIRTLLDAAQVRQDAVHERLFPSRDDILAGNVKIGFHRSCRASYTTKRNVQLVSRGETEPTPSTSLNQDADSRRRLLRADTSNFNIRRQCFVCAKSYKRSEKLTPISTGTGTSTRENMLRAAIERLDEEMRIRMLAYPDLFAFDASYHRSCYAAYISKLNIQATRRRIEKEQSETPFEKGFKLFCEELEVAIFSGNKPVLLLSELHSKFVEILQNVGAADPDSYRSWKLKKKLKGQFGDRLIFIPQTGKSDLMCSKDLTLGEALKRVSHLQLEKSDDGSIAFVGTESDLTDSMILHRAAGVVRRSIVNVSFISDSYPPSGEIRIGKCVAFVPTPLIEFIAWCTSQKAFESAMSFSDGCATDHLLQVLAISQNIIGLSNNIATPISFGLGIQMHHKFGSRQLIEVLHDLGHSVPYDEVRRFLTSVAEEDQQHEDTYIPRGIVKYKEDDVHSIVDAAIDNFDQNEETLDGRSTTHSMAAVLYQRTSTEDSMPGIPRLQHKALDAPHYLEDVLSIFNKPHTRPEPKRVAENVFDVQQADIHRQAELRDLVWKICRNMEDIDAVPAWSGFNALVSVSKIPVAIVRYLPFIKASPTDFSTVYTSILKLIYIAKSLGQSHILVTADLAIYSKAQQIIWSKLELQDSVTMRLGVMHLIMAFLASIGKLYGDGGFLDILTSSGVYATATAQQMLQGKHYARGIRGVKVVHEAMSHLFLSAAENFANKNGLPWIDDEFHTLVINLQSNIQTKNQSSCSEICLLLENKMSNLTNTINQFQAFGIGYSGTFMYWNSFLEAGDLLLRLVRADKEANFQLHLDSVMKTVPYFHLAGRINYARYTPIYVSEMRQLETKQPKMYQFQTSGGFVVRRSDKTKFNSVPTDQALEQTINREAKGTGGVIGFTLRKAALLRWLLTRHVSAEYSEAFQQLFEDKSEVNLHEELGPTRIARDKADVTTIKDYVKDHCQNPFDLESIPKELVNITTGQIATAAVEESLTSIPEKGKTILNNFLAARLMDGDTKSFWDAVPKSTVVTFASMKKALTFDKQRKIVLDPEVLFRRLLSVSKYRDINMRMVLSFELTPVPPALFHDDGTMRKTTKSDLADKLERNCPQETELKSTVHTPTAYIIDGMSFVQGVNESQFKTFNDLGEIVVKKLTRIYRNADLDVQLLTLVFDRYDVSSSIKGNERQRRGDTRADGSSHKIIGNRQVPNYRQFLKSGQNKAALIYFLSQYIEENAPQRIPQEQTLVIAGGHLNREVVREITDRGSRDLEVLFSTHDEADTRMILHATHSSTFPRTIVRCDDTDVLVLLLYYQGRGELSNDVYMHAGHSGKFVTRERFIPVSKIVKAIGMAQCFILPAVHALTGCDSTSAFFRLGKKTAYTILQKHQESLKGLTEFHYPGDEGIDAARELLLLMYGKTRKGRSYDTLDELRFVLSSTTDKPVSSLPPTDDAFRQHSLRAKFQTMIWCRSHIAKPRMRDPTEYGWVKCDENLQCVTSLKESAPKEIRDLTHLYCKDTDCIDGRKCPCVIAGLKCIEICSCSNCPNTVTVLQYDDNENYDED